MRKKVITLIRFLCGAIMIAGVLSAAAFLVSMIRKVPMPGLFLPYLLVLIPYTVSAFTIKRCETIAPFILITAASAALILLYPFKGGDIAVLVIITIVMIVLRMSGRFHKTEDLLSQPRIPVLALFVILFIIGASQKQIFFYKLNYYLAFAYTILLLIYYNFSNLENYLEINKAVQNIPTSQISRVNYGMLTLYLTLTLIAMIVLPLIGLDKAVAALGSGIMYIIRLLVSLLSRNSSPSESGGPPVTPPPADKESMPMEESPTPAWLAWLYMVLEKIAIFLVVVGLIALVIYLIYRLVQAFSRSYSNETDISEFIKAQDDRTVSIRPPLSSFFKKPEWLDFSPNAVIRRVYRKKIEKEQKKPPEDYYTPSEIEYHAGLEETDENRLLHDLYEKARYSETGVTKEEAKSLR